MTQFTFIGFGKRGFVVTLELWQSGVNWHTNGTGWRRLNDPLPTWFLYLYGNVDRFRRLLGECAAQLEARS